MVMVMLMVMLLLLLRAAWGLLQLAQLHTDN